MSLYLSTGFRTQILGTNSFSSILTGGKITIFSDSQPNNADLAATGTPLVIISANGGAGGLNFEVPANGIIVKSTTEEWQGTATATGVAGWFRFYEAGDDPLLASTTYGRLDGTVALTGGELNMSNNNIIIGSFIGINSFSYTKPAS